MNIPSLINRKLYGLHAIMGLCLVVLDALANQHIKAITDTDTQAETMMAFGQRMMTQTAATTAAIMTAHWEKIPVMSDEIRPVIMLLAMVGAGFMGMSMHTMHEAKSLATNHDTKEKLEAEFLLTIADLIFVCYGAALILIQSKSNPIRSRKVTPVENDPTSIELDELPSDNSDRKLESPESDDEGADEPIMLDDPAQTEPLNQSPRPMPYGLFEEGSPRRRRSPRHDDREATTPSSSPARAARKLAWS